VIVKLVLHTNFARFALKFFFFLFIFTIIVSSIDSINDGQMGLLFELGLCICVCVCVCVRGLLEKYPTVFFYANT